MRNIKLHLLLFLSVLIISISYGCKKNISSSISSVAAVPEKKVAQPIFTPLETGRAPDSIEPADFNGDGFYDLAIVDHGTNDLRFYWGRPGRTFEPGPVLGEDKVGYHPRMARAVDWDRDGRPDLILAGEGQNNVQYWHNGKDGWTLEGIFPVGSPAGLVVEDLDQDGQWDIIVGPYYGGDITILWGQKDFSFAVQKIKAAPTPTYIHVTDWNEDNLKDILWAEWDTGPVKVALNKGNRNFSIKELRPKPKKLDAPRSITTSDIDGDGHIDAIVPLEVGLAALILYGDGRGGVKNTETIDAPDWGFRHAAAIPATDKSGPLLALAEEGRICLYSKKPGIHSWQLIKELKAGSVPLDLKFFDLDMDGHLDLLFVNQAQSSGGIYYGPFKAMP